MAKVSNPIKRTGLVAKINALNSKVSSKSSEASFTEKPSTAINYPEFIKLLSEIIATKKIRMTYFSLATNCSEAN